MLFDVDEDVEDGEMTADLLTREFKCSGLGPDVKTFHSVLFYSKALNMDTL